MLIRILKYFFLIVTCFLVEFTNSTRLFSSCSLKGITPWNTNKKIIGLEIESWLSSVISVSQKIDNDNVHINYFNPSTGTYTEHWTGMVDDDFDPYDDARVITISKKDDSSFGLTWQYWSGRKDDGVLYGQLDTLDGLFTGNEIIYLYPDFLTGIKGTFENGKLVSGKAVDVIGERCFNGIKEIDVIPSEYNPDVIWFGEDQRKLQLPHDVGQHPTVMDPFERKSVYIDISNIEGAEEGIFARRDFRPGDIISYFSGQRTLTEQMFHDNMTDQAEAETASYYFNLGDNCASWWPCKPGVVIDIPLEFRSIQTFRRTLGHKCNHKFVNNNADFDTVLHPILGPVACIVANKKIKKNEEITVDYLYAYDAGPEWYQQQYLQTYNTTEDNLESRGG